MIEGKKIADFGVSGGIYERVVRGDLVHTVFDTRKVGDDNFDWADDFEVGSLTEDRIARLEQTAITAIDRAVARDAE